MMRNVDVSPSIIRHFFRRIERARSLPVVNQRRGETGPNEEDRRSKVTQAHHTATLFITPESQSTVKLGAWL